MIKKLGLILTGGLIISLICAWILILHQDCQIKTITNKVDKQEQTLKDVDKYLNKVHSYIMEPTPTWYYEKPKEDTII